MTVIYMTLLFSLNSLMRLDILAWVVGILLLVAALVLVLMQRRQYGQLKTDFAQLAKIKTHSVEYELVLKTMKLAVWRLDIANWTLTFESDYRDQGDSLPLPPGAPLRRSDAA